MVFDLTAITGIVLLAAAALFLVAAVVFFAAWNLTSRFRRQLANDRMVNGARGKVATGKLSDPDLMAVAHAVRERPRAKR